MAEIKEPTTGVLARIPDSKIAEVDEIAEVFGITRARFVVWAVELAVDRAHARMDEMRALREGLPAMPLDVAAKVLG